MTMKIKKMMNAPMNDLIANIKKVNRKRNIKTKRVKLLLKMYLKDDLFRKKTALNPSEIKSIIIIMIGKGIGDAIVMTGLVKLLSDSGYIVSILEEKRITHIFDELVFIKCIYTLKKNQDDKKTFEIISNKKYDLLIDIDDIDVHSPLRLSIIKKCRPKHTIGVNQVSRLYDTSLPHHFVKKHITARHIALAALMKIKTPSIEYTIKITESAEKETQEFIKSNKQKPFIVINPYGSEETRGMSPGQIFTLCNLCKDILGTLPLIIGIQSRLQEIPNWGNHLKFTLSSFQHVQAAVNACDIVVSTDTSIVHLSRGLNKHLICMYNNKKSQYGEDNNVLWGPGYEKATQILSPGNRVDQINPDIIFSHITRIVGNSIEPFISVQKNTIQESGNSQSI